MTSRQLAYRIRLRSTHSFPSPPITIPIYHIMGPPFPESASEGNHSTAHPCSPEAAPQVTPSPIQQSTLTLTTPAHQLSTPVSNSSTVPPLLSIQQSQQPNPNVPSQRRTQLAYMDREMSASRSPSPFSPARAAPQHDIPCVGLGSDPVARNANTGRTVQTTSTLPPKAPILKRSKGKGVAKKRTARQKGQWVLAG